MKLEATTGHTRHDVSSPPHSAHAPYRSGCDMRDGKSRQNTCYCAHGHHSMRTETSCPPGPTTPSSIASARLGGSFRKATDERNARDKHLSLFLKRSCYGLVLMYSSCLRTKSPVSLKREAFYCARRWRTNAPVYVLSESFSIAASVR